MRCCFLYSNTSTIRTCSPRLSKHNLSEETEMPERTAVPSCNTTYTPGESRPSSSSASSHALMAVAPRRGCGEPWEEAMPPDLGEAPCSLGATKNNGGDGLASEPGGNGEPSLGAGVPSDNEARFSNSSARLANSSAFFFSKASCSARRFFRFLNSLMWKERIAHHASKLGPIVSLIIGTPMLITKRTVRLPVSIWKRFAC
mmetsp:Transcript_52981/g.152635  ORF Transcript_52981/g.152635 Transcript_52981/m.152635 type:complete len:201 (-) Transcript_52981:1199-1801(-)